MKNRLMNLFFAALIVVSTSGLALAIDVPTDHFKNHEKTTIKLDAENPAHFSLTGGSRY